MTIEEEQAKRNLVCITLVHGTWAHGFLRRAPGTRPGWYDETGSFATSLTTLLVRRGFRPIFLQPCIWTGRNSLSARRACAAKVVRTMRRASMDYPDALRVVVAHSHGGTASLRALSRLPPRSAPHTLITMATPFIVTQSRRVTDGERLALTGASIIWGMAAFFLGLAALALSMRALVPAELVKGREWLFILALIFVAAILPDRATPFIERFRRWRARLVHRARQMTPHRLRPCELLVLRSPGDEASLSLSVGDAAELANGLTRSSFALPAFIIGQIRQSSLLDRTFTTLFYIMMASGLFLAIQGLLFPNSLNEAPVLTAIVASVLLLAGALTFGPLLVFVAITAILGVVASLSLLVSTVLAVAHGIEYPLFGWTVRTTAESSPLVFRVPCQSLRIAFRSGLRHGVYRHNKTLRVIADWIEEVSDRRRAIP